MSGGKLHPGAGALQQWSSFLCSDQTTTIFSRPGILKMALTCSTGLKVCFIFLNWTGSYQHSVQIFSPFLLFRQHFKLSTYFQCDAGNLPFNTIASSLQLLTVVYAAVLHTRFVAWWWGCFFLAPGNSSPKYRRFQFRMLSGVILGMHSRKLT